jgi:Spy/CpxP family protein refolding chaperone
MPLQGLRLAAATAVLALAGGLFQSAQAAPWGGPHGGGPGGGMLMGHPRMLERALDSVNATADQKAQIKAIATAAQADLRALRQQGRSLREQGMALLTAPNVDARAAEALRQQMLAQHDQASKRMLQAMLDTARVLTPEQRQQLAKKMADRRAMMERHRSERESLEGGRPPR